MLGGAGGVVQCRGRDIISPRDDMIKEAKVNQGEEVRLEGEGAPAPAISWGRDSPAIAFKGLFLEALWRRDGREPEMN